MRHVLLLLSCCALLAAAWTGHADAQASTPAPPGMITPDQPHVRSNNTTAGTTGSTGQPLSSQLAQTNGTLHPAPVDPGMQKTPTQPGTMPVIPPPGTAGGAPGAVAK